MNPKIQNPNTCEHFDIDEDYICMDCGEQLELSDYFNEDDRIEEEHEE